MKEMETANFAQKQNTVAWRKSIDFEQLICAQHAAPAAVIYPLHCVAVMGIKAPVFSKCSSSDG